jgi:hypothetical protein
MSRKKNLLEAFSRSDAPGAPPAGAGVPSAPPVSGATLFDGVSTRTGSGLRPAWALAVIGLVVSFVLGYVTGRGASGEAKAAGGEGAPAPSAPRVPPANQPRAFQERLLPAADAPKEEQRLEDSPLFDPANLHSVVVAAYSKSNQDLAWATYQHVHEAGLPVFPPVASRNLVVVLVGAAPTESELYKTRDAVRALLRDGKKAYADAYVTRIDPLIPRTNTTKGN